MSLDIFQNDQAAAQAEASRHIADDLPSEFSEGMRTSWRYMTDWHSSVAYEASKAEALAQFGDDIYNRTGERLPTTSLGEGLISTDEFNSKLTGINEKYPVNLSPLTDQDIDRMALQRMAKAKRAGDELSRRQHTWGGTFGSALGTLGGGLADPVAAITLPLGGAGELSVLARMAEFGLISGGTEATTAALSGPARERAVPGSSKEIPGEVLMATGAGALLGGAHGLLEQWLRAGARSLPTSVRDEVNAGTAEAQINATNVFTGAAGETAGRDGLVQAAQSAARGEPITAGRDFDQAHVDRFAAGINSPQPGYVRFYHGGAEPTSGGARFLTPDYDYARDFRSMGEPKEVHFVDIPRADLETDPALRGGYDEVNGTLRNFEAPESIAQRLRPMPALTTDELAAAGDRALRPLTHDVVPDVEHFDAFDYWEGRLEGAGEEDRAAIGATDHAEMNAPVRDVTPRQAEKLSAEPSTANAVLRDLDRYRVANPEAEFSTQVRMPDGSYQLVTRKLEEVMDELDGLEKLGDELMGCAIGLDATVAAGPAI